MADWMTCRVVRDRDGDLWFRGCDSDDLWTANTNYPDVFLTTDEVVTVFGPLMPVLDADGLPVVRTVGDLTARHLGRLIDDGNPAYVVRLGSVGHSSTGTRYTGHVIRRDNGKVAGNVRCERVNPSTPVEVLP